MSENKDVLKLTVMRTLVPKPYHSVKVGLEFLEVVDFSTIDKEEKINGMYSIMRKKLNEIEQYEVERMR